MLCRFWRLVIPYASILTRMYSMMSRRGGRIVFTNGVIIDYHYRYYSCVGRVQITGLRETGIRTGSRKARITRVSH